LRKQWGSDKSKDCSPTPKEVVMKEVGRAVLMRFNAFTRVRIWYAGHIKIKGGVITFGFRGEPQTYIDVDLIRPIGVVKVREVKVA
jgi:hypothetical protein